MIHVELHWLCCLLCELGVQLLSRPQQLSYSRSCSW
ncbi:hypothetical protein ZOSMA_74G00140 [Zostera marina]|uniref:Uncharacterized protein n=1 Tax=Zostera marina TaxID=29655 RepID=A0A0K9NPZ9_ZOSMR|nr:hypothetical protein ZOSMA_74G00140 [Zostera marina]